MKTQQFNEWLDTLIEEKNIDLDDQFELEGPSGLNIMSYGVIIESIKNTSNQEQNKIKDVLVKIDFKNGDIKHFFRHLGQALVC